MEERTPYETGKDQKKQNESDTVERRVMPEVYVVVADNDQGHKMPNRDDLFYDDGGPLVFETYVNKGTVEGAREHIARLNGKYGKCKITRLDFVEA